MMQALLKQKKTRQIKINLSLIKNNYEPSESDIILLNNSSLFIKIS